MDSEAKQCTYGTFVVVYFKCHELYSVAQLAYTKNGELSGVILNIYINRYISLQEPKREKMQLKYLKFYNSLQKIRCSILR